MYAKYQWLSTATEAQIRSDLVALATGATIASLSASCDKVNSAIIVNTTPAGWTVHDATASATSQVITAPNLDGTTAKYIQITQNAGTLTFTGWESWNAGTHIGTNQTAANAAVMSAGPLPLVPTTPNAVYVLATARRLCITQGPMWGTTFSIHAAEFSRDTAALDITFPVTAIFTTNTTTSVSFLDSQYNVTPATNLGVCRIKNPVAAGNLTGTGINYAFPNLTRLIWTQTNYGNFTSPTLSSTGATYLTALPITISATANGSNFFVLGKIQGGTLYFPGNMPQFSHLDEIVIGGTTYVLIKLTTQTSSPNALAIAYPKE